MQVNLAIVYFGCNIEMNLLRTSSKSFDLTKKGIKPSQHSTQYNRHFSHCPTTKFYQTIELVTQSNASLVAVDHRKTFKDTIEKDFIGVLRMKYEMELTYLKSMDKIQRICQEKVEKYTNSANHS